MPDKDISTASKPLPGSADRPLRLGLLLPYSTICPALAESFTLGLRAGLKHPAGGTPPLHHQLAAASIGTGGRGVTALLGKLMIESRPDLIVAMFGTGTIHLNDRELAGCGRPIINATLGANVSLAGHLLPNMATLSASTWQSAVALGEHAATKFGRKALLVSSFFDCGFDSFFCLRQGFESAGGEVLLSRLVDSPTEPRSPEQIIEEARNAGAEIILSNLSGPIAESFVRAWSQLAASERLPLLGTAFLTEQPVLDTLETSAMGVKTAGPCLTADTEATAAFLSAHEREADGMPADLFSVMGWETAHLIRWGLASVPEPTRTPLDFMKHLSSWVFDSPRGQIRMAQQHRIATGPLYLREIVANENGLRHQPLLELPPVAMDDSRIQPIIEASLASGWANEYLCI